MADETPETENTKAADAVSEEDQVLAEAKTAAAAAEHADAQHLARAGVVRHPEPRLLLDHRARSTTSVNRQRFSLENGRVSATRTRSPRLAVSSASCT